MTVPGASQAMGQSRETVQWINLEEEQILGNISRRATVETVAFPLDALSQPLRRCGLRCFLAVANDYTKSQIYSFPGSKTRTIRVQGLLGPCFCCARSRDRDPLEVIWAACDNGNNFFIFFVRASKPFITLQHYGVNNILFVPIRRV